jgi:16S rRNA (adenine1518-N6/adenine1519-N6)-dimethyltransferase
MEDNIQAKKSLGQHWLRDESALQAMCESAQITDQDYVLEIGPGLGTLTQLLVQKAEHVHAVEFDQQLAKDLSARVTANNLTISSEDILAFDLNNLPQDYKIVANIPYYLTSNLIRKISESTNPPSRAVLLIQKEVAERVDAQTRRYVFVECYSSILLAKQSWQNC